MTPLKIYGAATAAYGAMLIAQPKRLLDPMQAADTDRMRDVAKAIGARDLISGAWLVLADGRRERRQAIAARVLCDAGDVFALANVAAPEKRGLVRGVAAAWAGVALLALRATD